MLYTDICRIISEWDPVGIADISPKDEYYGEAGQIYDHIMSNNKITPEELGEAIQKILYNSFDELFRRTKDDCIKVAEKIMDIMWNRINTSEDIDRLFVIFEGFHDSCIKEINYISGLYIDDDLYMSAKQNSVEIIFDNQSKSTNGISIRFIGVIEFNINKRKEYIHELCDASMFIKDKYIYWADSEDFDVDHPSGSWICSKKAVWRLI